MNGNNNRNNGNRSNGALWITKSRKGVRYLSGNVEISGETYKIAVFKNELKEPGETTPDYRIFTRDEQAQKRVSSRQENRAPRDDEFLY